MAGSPWVLSPFVPSALGAESLPSPNLGTREGSMERLRNLPEASSALRTTRLTAPPWGAPPGEVPGQTMGRAGLVETPEVVRDKVQGLAQASCLPLSPPPSASPSRTGQS